MDPETTTAIVEQAAHEAGWVAALLVVIVIAVFALFGWFIRQLWNMQIADRAASTETHRFVREDMASIIARDHDVMSEVSASMKAHTRAIDQFARVIANAPCGDAQQQRTP